MSKAKVLLEIVNCMNCPHVKTKDTPRAGCATDYICGASPDPSAEHGFKMIKGYVEWGSENPKDGQIPQWCPLPFFHTYSPWEDVGAGTLSLYGHTTGFYIRQERRCLKCGKVQLRTAEC